MEAITNNQLVRHEFQAGENKFDVWIYVDENQVPWFKAKDVALALGYVNCEQSIRKNVDEENKCETETRYGVADLKLPPNWQPTTILINEAGVYDLILASKKPAAKSFKRWVTNDVLPTLRKTGSYSMTQAPTQQREQLGMINELLTTKNEVINLLKRELEYKNHELESRAKRIKENETIIKEMEPLVVNRLLDDDKMNCLEVWQLDNDDQRNFSYRGLRVQKRNLEAARKPGERLIFYAETPNAINIWNSLKESGHFTVKSNVITSTLDREEFLNLLTKKIPEGQVIEAPNDDAEELYQTMTIKTPLKMTLEEFREIYTEIEDFLDENVEPGDGFIRLPELFKKFDGIKCKSKEFVAIVKNILLSRGGEFMTSYSPVVNGKPVKYYNVIHGFNM